MPANIEGTLGQFQSLLRPDTTQGLDLSAYIPKDSGVDLSSFVPKGTGPAPSGLSYWQGLGESLLWNLNPRSLIGDKPGEEVQQWQAENPWSSLGTALVGSTPYYAAGAGLGGAALRAVAPGVGRAIGVGSSFAGRAPTMAAAARTAVELVPFEAARLAGAAAFAENPEGLTETALSAGLDLATAGVFGAGAQFLRTMKRPVVADPGDRIKEIWPDFDPTLSAQEQIQRLRTLRTNTPEESKELLSRIDDAMVDRMNVVRWEGTSEKNYVKDFVGGGDAKEIRRFFKTQVTDKEGASIHRRRFMTRDTGGFKSETDWINAWKETGLPEEAFGYVQFPRHISFGKEAGAQDFQKSIANSLLPMPEGWWMRQEADSGLYVMAKKVAGGGDIPTPADKWVLLKTSEPNKLIGKDVVTGAANKAAVFMTKVQQRLDTAAVAELLKQTPDALVGVDQAFTTAIPKQKYTQTIHPLADRAREMLPQDWQNASREVQAQLGDAWTWAKGLVAPAQAQFRKAPQAEYVRLRAQNLYTGADAKANMALYGDQWSDPSGNLYKGIIGKRKVGGLKGAVDALDEKDMPLLTGIINNRLGLDEAEQLLAGADAGQKLRILNFLKAADDSQARMMGEVIGTQKLTGKTPVELLPGHYGVPHTWRGDRRMRVEDELGRTIGYGAGRTDQEAIDEARALIQRVGKGRLAWKQAQTADSTEDLMRAEAVGRMQRKQSPLFDKLGSKAPLTHLERQEMLGWIGESKPFTKDELFDVMRAHYQRQYKYVADMLVRKNLAADVIESGRLYGREVFDQLNYRLAKMSGAKGTFDKATNELSDRLFAPALGRNSADKIAGTFNQIEFSLALLAGNLAFPVMNALTFVQTVLPKIALTLRTPPERLHEFMHFTPAFDKAGRPSGVMSIFEPWKLAKAGFRSLRKPTDEERLIFQRGAREGVVAPRYVEEFLGEKSRIAANLGEVVRGKAPVTRLLRAISEWPAAKTEEFSRAHALMTGYHLGKRMFGLGDNLSQKDNELLYQWAKQFAFRTMYQYSTADRAKIFNGPLGGMAGLFKNWMFHNVADLGTYAGEAFKHGNVMPLMWALGGTGAIAGVGGLPLFELMNAATKVATDKNLMQHIYEGWDPPEGNVGNPADALYYGLPGLLGISLQSSAAGPFNNPIKDVNFLFNIAVLERARKIGQFFGDTYQQWEAGNNPLESDRTADLALYAFAPRTLYKAFAQVEDGALKSIRNGRPIVDVEGLKVAGIDTNWLTNTFGFTPTKIARAYELSEEFHSDQQKMRDLTTQYGEAYARAWEQGDQEAMTFVLGRALASGADVSRVMKSAVTRIQDQRRAMLETEFRTLPTAYSRMQALGLGGV
jgi:hypothetical protein